MNDRVKLDGSQSNIVELTFSNKYKERFKGEYLLLEDRVVRLRDMVERYQKGTLDFKPNCSYLLLKAQLNSMESYLAILGERSRIEGIDV